MKCVRSVCVAGVFSLVVHGIEGAAMVLVACVRMPPTFKAFVVPSTSPSNGLGTSSFACR